MDLDRVMVNTLAIFLSVETPSKNVESETYFKTDGECRWANHPIYYTKIEYKIFGNKTYLLREVC